MKNSCPQWDSNPGPSAYEANALSVELLELINIDHPKVTAFEFSVLQSTQVKPGEHVVQVIYVESSGNGGHL